jgi:CHAT domain-containing protein
MLDGGMGNNTLNSLERSNNLEITGIDTGNINQETNFKNIQNFITGNFADSFIFTHNNATITGNIIANSGALNLIGDHINFQGIISGTENLNINTLNPNQNIEIGSVINSPNNLTLTQTELNLLQNGFSSITIGNQNYNGNMILTGSFTVNDPLIINAGLGKISHQNLQNIPHTITGKDNATLTFLALGDITLGNITNSQRDITLISREGVISTGNINTSGLRGGAIYLNAREAINTGNINSSGTLNSGGNVILDPLGDVNVGYINAQGGDQGKGGMVDITAGQNFRATGIFSDRQGNLASISTAGGLGGGNITLRHGGNLENPFIIGNLSPNGTLGSITSGEFNKNPLRVIPFTSVEGNIQIIGLASPNDLTNNLGSKIDFTQNLQNSIPNVVNLDTVIGELDQNFTDSFQDYLGKSPSQKFSLAQSQTTLKEIEEITGVNPAIIYARFVSSNDGNNPSDKKLQLVLVSGKGEPLIYNVNVTEKEILETGLVFSSFVTNIRRENNYQIPAQQLYQWLIAPLETDLTNQNITNLVFILDQGLRSLPLAALYDGEKHLVEKYNMGLMPSLALTDISYSSLKNTNILAMGAETFADQTPLPAVPIEIREIVNDPWAGDYFLNSAFTVANLLQARKNKSYGIIHLATHGEFRPGQPSNSYIQFGDRKVQLDNLQELEFNQPPVDLMVLSACRTALGDADAELGFAGLAVLAGVKSALGSLWNISDEGTLGLMVNFYYHLNETPIKAQALQQAQLAMLRGEIKLENGNLITPHTLIPLPKALAEIKDQDFSHPYYWSAFTMIGNPW